jgi:hypothetical protein
MLNSGIILVVQSSAGRAAVRTDLICGGTRISNIFAGHTDTRIDQPVAPVNTGGQNDKGGAA